MNILKVGDNAPDFSCKNQHGNTVNLSDMIGKKVVLFFYPKANTPGCTAEACNLNDNITDLNLKVMRLLGFQQIVKKLRKTLVISLVLNIVYFAMRTKK
jgi:peroxiredoxin Q/BCP